MNWLDRENPQSGGAEEHLHEIFGRLADRGHEVTALVSGWRGAEPRVTLDGIDVHRTGRRYTFSIAAPLYYRRHLRDHDFDVVVEDLNKIPLYGRAWTDGPVVLLAHHLFGATAFQAGPPPVAAVTWLLEHTIPRAYRGLPAIVVSHSTEEDFLDKGLRPERMRVIPNGIRVDHYTPGPEGCRTERPTLLFLGRLKKYKRVDLVLTALPHVVKAGIDVRFLVGGTGDQRSALEAEAKALGISDRVDFLGFIADPDKLERLRTSWLHVLTSTKEGWGISNLEAAACGTPTVASDAPGLRESVVDGLTGRLVPHGDVGELVNVLTELLTDHERRRRMGADARRFAEGFSWDASATAFEEELHRVVALSADG